MTRRVEVEVTTLPLEKAKVEVVTARSVIC